MVRYQKALVYTRLHLQDIHVWRYEPADSETSIILSDDERQRAARFVFEKDQRFFAACRSALRVLLGRYLERRAEDISFVYSERGKPRVAGESDLRFNVSHSGGLAIFAFTLGCELGVDVEMVKPVAEMDRIAQRFFCQEEFSELVNLPENEKPDAFFRCWTRKEAYIKATGDGLSAPLDQFQVTFGAQEDARFVHINHDKTRAAQWTLQALHLDSPFVGALAYEAPPKEILLFDLTRGSDSLRP